MNSGKFAFHADIMLDELRNMGWKSPLQRSWAVEGMVRDLDLLRLPAEPFGRAPMKWIDCAVMERAERAAVVPVDLGWSDVRS